MALALDRQSTEAQSWLARVLSTRRAQCNDRPQPAADLARRGWADRPSLGGIAPQARMCISSKAKCCALSKRWEEAIPEYEAAARVEIATCLFALHGLARCKLYVGSIEEVTALEEQAIRLSPPRSLHRPLLLPHWNRASAAIAHRRSDRLARKKRAAPPAYPTVPSQPPRLRLCPQRRNRTRRRRTRRKPGGWTAEIFFSSIAPPEGPFLAHGRGHRRPAPCSRPPISPGCARPACRRNDRDPAPSPPMWPECLLWVKIGGAVND